MDSVKKKARIQRAKKMNIVLRKLYSNPKIALNYSNLWELMVAVQLSAQCTDERVNKVTEKLFQKYRTISDYANASQRDMEHDVYQCGFYRNKAKNIRGAASMIMEKYNKNIPVGICRQKRTK